MYIVTLRSGGLLLACAHPISRALLLLLPLLPTLSYSSVYVLLQEEEYVSDKQEKLKAAV